MSTFDALNHYFSGQGVVMIGVKDTVTGNPLGLRPLGNVPDLKISISTTVVEHKGSQDGQRAIDRRLQTETKCNMSMTIENWIAKNLALALRGGQTPIIAGTVVGESVKAYPGLVSSFKFINVAAVSVKQGATTLTAYTDGVAPWDYKINLAAGSIMMNDGIAPNVAFGVYVPTSPVDAGATLTVGYTYGAQFLVDSLTQPLTDAWLRFEGLNTVENNDPVVVDVFRFVVDPLKELALLSDTYGQFVMEGSVLKDDTRLTGTKYFAIKKLN